MKAMNFLEKYLARFPLGAAICYVAVVIVFLLMTLVYVFPMSWNAAGGGSNRRYSKPLEGRNPSPSRTKNANGVSFVTGSPVLEGPTVTVAGATLLQRVAGAVTRFGGNILSSQVDLQGVQLGRRLVKVSVDCEIDQPSSLQQLLYDLSAGKSFLFVDQLVAQAPETGMGADERKMRVSILVSGQWQGAK